MRAAITILLTATWLALPAIAAAQEPVLQVRLVDAAGAGVPGVAIALRDADGTQDLGAQTTDIHGEATFVTLPTTTVRLSLGGIAPSGATISLGETSFLDEPAILVHTDIGGPHVALVMDDGGLVYLDPAAIEPEGGSEASPTAALAPAPAHVTPAPAHATPAPAAPERAPFVVSWWARILIGLILTGIAILFSLEWRVRS